MTLVWLLQLPKLTAITQGLLENHQIYQNWPLVLVTYLVTGDSKLRAGGLEGGLEGCIALILNQLDEN